MKVWRDLPNHYNCSKISTPQDHSLNTLGVEYMLIFIAIICSWLHIIIAMIYVIITVE